ncbi:rab GTPase-binding effector protein 1-like [Elysia marginata]|uniref:Rab GTPase-binding effector protein 1-like n=1 Tax=Elysia marginata TaxID=1093978 RepID=A0AAV4HCW3_9GAST|nr:rab GTPase-binding effector protein 1-like [Elysia marginata]
MSTVHLQLQDHCKSLADDWGEVQKEKDKVVDKYSKTTQQLQNEDSNLPNNLEEMQLRLLKYCEEIISTKVAKEHAENTVRAQVGFPKGPGHRRSERAGNFRRGSHLGDELPAGTS